MSETKVSRRGVYYDLEASPYVYKSPYGDSFKFPSQKRLDMYSRDVLKEVEKLNRQLDRFEIRERLPEEILQLITRTVYRAFYEKFMR